MADSWIKSAQDRSRLHNTMPSNVELEDNVLAIQELYGKCLNSKAPMSTIIKNFMSLQRELVAMGHLYRASRLRSLLETGSFSLHNNEVSRERFEGVHKVV